MMDKMFGPGRAAMALLAAIAILFPPAVLAADADRGHLIAQQQCAACHSIAHVSPQDVIAASPPFEVIGRKHGFDARSLALFIRGPHRKMNFAITGRDAGDIAAYIATLAR